LAGCLFVWLFLDIAEHNHGAMSFGQPVDLLVNDVDRVVRRVELGPIRGQLKSPVLDFLAAFLLAFRLDGRAERNAMKPGTDGVANPERAGLAYEDEKSGLEGITGVVFVAKDSAARAPDQWPVPLNQRGERGLGRFAIALRKPLEQLPIGDPSERADLEEGLQAMLNDAILVL
jgi:hypothetical protein